MVIKFVKYEEVDLYCNGICTLNIDGIDMTFGSKSYCDFPKFWSTGGWYNIDDGSSVQLPWVKNKFTFDEFPIELQNEMNTMLQVFNDNVEYGCCGECI